MSHPRPVFLDSRKTFPRQQNFKEAEGPGRGSPNSWKLDYQNKNVLKVLS